MSKYKIELVIKKLLNSKYSASDDISGIGEELASEIKRLHGYQKYAANWAYQKLEASFNLSQNWYLIKAPTGSGKTLIGIAFLAEAQKKYIDEKKNIDLYYLTYTKIAQSQTEAAIKEMKQSNLIDKSIDIKVVCIQGFVDKNIQNESIVVFDEAHHIRQDGSFRNFLFHSKKIKFLLGLTGTPRKKFPDDGFKKCLLIPKECCTRKFPNLKKIDLKFKPEKLNHELGIGNTHLSNSENLDDICSILENDSEKQRKKYLKLIASELYIHKDKIKKAIVFTEYQQDAIELAEELNLIFNDFTAFPLVSGLKKFMGENGAIEIKRYLKLLKSDDSNVKFVVGCDMISEAFDMPNINTLVLTKNTSSDILYSQWVGRGTREYKGKDTTYIFDFRLNFDKYHKNTSKDSYLFSGCDYNGDSYGENIEAYSYLHDFDFKQLDVVVNEFLDWFGLDMESYIGTIDNPDSRFPVTSEAVYNFLRLMCFKNASAHFSEIAESEGDIYEYFESYNRSIQKRDELLSSDQINKDQTKPLEVSFVKRVITPMIQKLYEDVQIELTNEDQSRCDLVINAKTRTVIEFDMGDATEKFDRIKNYHNQLNKVSLSNKFENIIVGCTFKDQLTGIKSARSRKLDSGYNVFFINWLDFFFLFAKREISAEKLFESHSDLKKKEKAA